MRVPPPAKSETSIPVGELTARLQAGEAVVREAGARAADYFRRRVSLTIQRKSLQDFVSEADRVCEELIVTRLSRAYGGDAVLGEEGGRRGHGNVLWVIDPIDGTTNFLRGIPFWCVSVGLLLNLKPILGLIYDPINDELFSAVEGRGAFLNGAPIRVSGESQLTRARVCVGFSYRRPVEPHTRAVKALLDAGCEYARLGSGALGMAYTAAGRFDGYWEHHINAWDVAAAMAIVSEAGGVTNDFFAGNGLEAGNQILAATPALSDPLRLLLPEG